jgi:hypothetical protein
MRAPLDAVEEFCLDVTWIGCGAESERAACLQRWQVGTIGTNILCSEWTFTSVLVADFYYYAILKSYQQMHKGSSPRFLAQLLVYSRISFIISDIYVDG